MTLAPPWRSAKTGAAARGARSGPAAAGHTTPAGAEPGSAEPTPREAPASRRAVRAARAVLAAARRGPRRAVRAATGAWRKSLQLRVVISTLALSVLIIAVLGVVLTGQVTDRLLEMKTTAAIEELDAARSRVELSLAGDTDLPLQTQLANAATSVTSRELKYNRGNAAGAFGIVLIAPGDGTLGPTTSGAAQVVPEALRSFIQSGQIGYQYTTVRYLGGYTGPTLVVGTPTVSSVAGVELYLVFPLEAEGNFLDLVRGTLAIGGLSLALLLGAVALLVTRQVVLPLRAASRVAVRFADGRLTERMTVNGEDDMARLAVSFNDMAESLSNQITSLREFGDLQRRFTSDVSHELRTPLTTVRMAADLIREHADELEPGLNRASELLVAELDRFETLLADLLEISRHDAGVADLVAEQLDVRICAEEAAQTVRHLALASNTELVVELPDEEVLAEVDPRRVERILRNLLANALDHGEGKPVLLRLAASADALAFTVRDHGIGLRPGEEKLVFNRFWRSDPSRRRHSGGSGLGLAISAEDANLHGGKLQAWGAPDEGAVFRLTLPRAPGAILGASPLPLGPESAMPQTKPPQLALPPAAPPAPAPIPR